MWKPDFVTTHMYHGVPDLLSRAEAAQVDAEMSVDPECRCQDLLVHSQLTVCPVFHLLDHDREREFELSDKDVPASE
jgi:hypothetical protein